MVANQDVIITKMQGTEELAAQVAESLQRRRRQMQKLPPQLDHEVKPLVSACKSLHQQLEEAMELANALALLLPDVEPFRHECKPVVAPVVTSKLKEAHRRSLDGVR